MPTIPRAQSTAVTLKLSSRHAALGGVLGLLFAACSGSTPDSGGTGTTGGTGTAIPTGGTTTMTGTSGSTTSTGGVTGVGGSNAAAGTAASTGGVMTTAGTGGSLASGGATSGAGGMTAAGGSSEPGGRPSGPSAGCMKDAPAGEGLGKQTKHMITVSNIAAKYMAGYTNRVYCTTLPENYDPTKPDPVVFYGPGCGASSCEGTGSFNGASFRNDVFMIQAISAQAREGPLARAGERRTGLFSSGQRRLGGFTRRPVFRRRDGRG